MDPREHLANERTFLAWVRTSLGLIGLGFVLARMGLFLRQLAATGLINGGHRLHLQAGGEFLVSGVCFLILGTLVCAYAGWNYQKNRQAMTLGTFVPARSSVFVLCALIVAGSLLIAAMVVGQTLVAVKS